MAIKIQQCVRTLRLKVKAEGYAWLNAAATEVNPLQDPLSGSPALIWTS